MELINPYTVDEQALMLAKHLPTNRVWESGWDFDEPFGQLLKGLAVEFYRYQILCKQIIVEMDINKADALLIEWEKSLGLPDDCFRLSPPETIEKRRQVVIAKLTKYGGVQTASDFVRVANLFDFDIAVLPGSAVGFFPLEFPISFFTDGRTATHTVFIQMIGRVQSDSFFPLPFPIPFSSGGITFLRCLFETLIPANVRLIVRDV